MSSVIKFELIQKHEELLVQKHEELLEEMAELQEEIEILNLLLKKVQSEYLEVDGKIKKNQQLGKMEMVDMR